MKQFILTILFTISSFFLVNAQKYEGADVFWIDYEIIVDNQDTNSVVNILDSFFSKPENRIEGVTYNLTEFNFKDKDFKATHLFQLVGSADALNEWHHGSPSLEGQLIGTLVNQYIKPYSAFFGKNIVTFGTQDNDAIEFVYALNVNDEEKFTKAWSKAIGTLNPDRFVGFGSVLAAGSDNQTHYIYSQRKNLKDILSPQMTNGSDKVWKTFREEAGDFEVIRTLVRTRVKIWE